MTTDEATPHEATPKKLRVGLVLIAGASQGGGGTGRRFARLFQYFQQNESSVDVWLITMPEFLELMGQASIEIDPDNNVIHFEDGPRDTSNSILSKLKSFQDYSDRLAALVRKYELDVVHIPIPDRVYAPFFLRRRDGIRQSFSMTAAVGAFDKLNWKARILYQIGFECSYAIDTLYSDTKERFPSYAHKVQVSPCSFTDYSHYYPADTKEKWIVFAGRLEPFKNPHLFVSAVSLAANVLRENGWKCLLLGGGILSADVEEQISALGLSDLIEVDSVADLSPKLNRSMVYTSIQKTENYPSQSLLESMASGNAIIATDVGDTRRIVDEEVGLLIDEQTSEALADALMTLARDPLLCERLAENARSRILTHHTVARFANYMEQFWTEDTMSAQGREPRPSWLKMFGILINGALGRHFY